MRRLFSITAVAITLAMGASGAARAGQPLRPRAANASVTFVGVLPNTPVDIAVDGTIDVHNLKPGTISGAVSLTAGSHKVDVHPAGQSSIIVSGSFSLTGGTLYSIAAQLNAQGAAALSSFTDPTTLGASKAGILGRNVAAVPPIDVRLKTSGSPAMRLKNIPSGQGTGAQVAPSQYGVDALAAGTNTTLAGPINVGMSKCTWTTVYVWGSQNAHTLAMFAVQRHGTC